MAFDDLFSHWVLSPIGAPFQKGPVFDLKVKVLQICFIHFSMYPFIKYLPEAWHGLGKPGVKGSWHGLGKPGAMTAHSASLVFLALSLHRPLFIAWLVQTIRARARKAQGLRRKQILVSPQTPQKGEALTAQRATFPSPLVITSSHRTAAHPASHSISQLGPLQSGFWGSSGGQFREHTPTATGSGPLLLPSLSPTASLA